MINMNVAPHKFKKLRTILVIIFTLILLVNIVEGQIVRKVPETNGTQTSRMRPAPSPQIDEDAIRWNHFMLLLSILVIVIISMVVILSCFLFAINRKLKKL